MRDNGTLAERIGCASCRLQAREVSVQYAVGIVSCGSALFVSEGLLKAQLRAGPSALMLLSRRSSVSPR